MKINSDLLKKAYKKLKSSIYYDKTELILRNKIVEFEYETVKNEESLDAYFDKLFARLIDYESYQKLQEEILENIGYHAFPKKLSAANDKNILFNFSLQTSEIEELQYFIDLDIEGHILGVLWLMLMGYKIDQSIIYEHSYGNRIRKQLYNELSQEPTFSPYLFQPYFQQYESWRDTGLNAALAHLNKKQDVVVITMDFQRFYYSVDMTEEASKQILMEAEIAGSSEEYSFCKQLNDFVYSVICKYSDLFDSKIFNKRKILPIGFLPSNVLSNWCLRNFDKAIVDGWNPLYYGRYVDDVLIVDKVEHKSDLYQKAQKQELDKEDVIQFFLLIQFFLRQSSRWKGILEDNWTELAPLIRVEHTETEKDDKYRLNPLFNPLSNDQFQIFLQNKKLKIFYFKSGETKALITCFQEEISRNKSEFRFMPEEHAVFEEDDYAAIYKLQNNDTINKFRGIDGMTLDRYKLSKFLGKSVRIGSMIDDKVESDFENSILKIFDSRTILDNYIQWEKILEILVINERYKAVNQFVEKVINAIQNIKISTKIAEHITIEEVKYALYATLYSALSKVFALVIGETSDKVISELYDSDTGVRLKYLLQQSNVKLCYEIQVMREAYRSTKMLDKSVIPVALFILNTINEHFNNEFDKMHKNDLAG